MRLILDTHVVLWWAQDQVRLSGTAIDALEVEGADLMLSAVVAWEVAIKRAAGKLDIDPDWLGVLLDAGARELPVTIAHADETARLPLHHPDPFDRLLVAQARVERASLVTADARLSAYDVPILW